MSWREAYRRAAVAVLSLIIIDIIGVVAIGIGALIAFGFIGDSLIIGAFGGLLALAGVIVILLGILAVVIKTITDAVRDNLGSIV